MIVLAFDPGHCTGVAWIDDSKVLFSCAIRVELFTDEWINRLLKLANPDLIVIEELPPYRPDTVTSTIYNRLISLCRATGKPIRTVKPGTWKPVIKRRKIDYTPHIKDAVGIGLYQLALEEEK
jgi:hypothetical protein